MNDFAATGELIMKLKLVKFLAKLGVLGLLLGGVGTALLLSGCHVGLPPEPDPVPVELYPVPVEPDPVPVEYPGPVEPDPVHEMDKK